jgi:hypothetical protein
VGLVVIVLSLAAAADRVDLEDPEDLRRFHVRVEGGHDPRRIGAAFESTGLGSFQSPERAMVSVAMVRALAEGRVGLEWDKQFESMLAYAAKKGWYDREAGMVQAHCELGPVG